MNIITEVGILIFKCTSQKPQTTNYKCIYFSPLVGTTLPRFTSALTHSRSTISGATNEPQTTHRRTVPTRQTRANSPWGQHGSCNSLVPRPRPAFRRLQYSLALYLLHSSGCRVDCVVVSICLLQYIFTKCSDPSSTWPLVASPVASSIV